MDRQLAEVLRRLLPDAEHVAVEGFEAIPGGFSRETFRFDAHVTRAGVTEAMPMILRKDPPAVEAILYTSRQTEHELLGALGDHTGLPVSVSYGCELDASVFGEPAMVIQRVHGNGHTSDLFHDGPDVDQVDAVIGHLCELMAELHTADIAKLDVGGKLSDPRGVGIDTSSWDAYMDSTIEYYISSYPDIAYDPIAMVILDGSLSLRRNKPRPLPLAVVHGDFNPANFLYADGKVTAIIDWENTRIGDPREDLGWMVAMDNMSNTSVMSHPRDKGGFLAYYNELTGFDVTEEELGYFMIFGTMNIAVPITAAVKRRVNKEHSLFLHLYLVQPSAPTLIAFAQLLGYPGVQPAPPPEAQPEQRQSTGANP